METSSTLDLALRQHQATLRLLEEMLYGNAHWVVEIGSESFPAEVSLAPGGDGVRVMATVDRPCAGQVCVRPSGISSTMMLVHPVPWEGSFPSRLEWDIVLSKSLASA